MKSLQDTHGSERLPIVNFKAAAQVPVGPDRGLDLLRNERTYV
jgi:hypothetical protein